MDAIDKTGTSRSAHDLLMDIQWNCEHCTARLTFKRNAEAAHENGVPEGTSPCNGCRLQKYGYGGEVK